MGSICVGDVHSSVVLSRIVITPSLFHSPEVRFGRQLRHRILSSPLPEKVNSYSRNMIELVRRVYFGVAMATISVILR